VAKPLSGDMGWPVTPVYIYFFKILRFKIKFKKINILMGQNGAF
jgi:hypothetical protein